MTQQLIENVLGSGDSLQAGSTKINENFTELYNALADISTLQQFALPQASGDILGGVKIGANITNVSGTISVAGPSDAVPHVNGAAGSPGTSLSYSRADHNHKTDVPVGAIILWYGSVASIPSGWHLCNGTGGTPDLQDRFVVGAGGNFAVSATGGSADTVVTAHTHTSALVMDIVNPHAHTITDPGHIHTMPYSNGIASPASTDYTPGEYGSKNTTTVTQSATTGLSINAGGTHTPTGNVTIDSAGVSGTDQNLPPYYALCYIMRVA